MSPQNVCSCLDLFACLWLWNTPRKDWGYKIASEAVSVNMEPQRVRSWLFLPPKVPCYLLVPKEDVSRAASHCKLCMVSKCAFDVWQLELHFPSRSWTPILDISWDSLASWHSSRTCYFFVAANMGIQTPDRYFEGLSYSINICQRPSTFHQQCKNDHHTESCAWEHIHPMDHGVDAPFRTRRRGSLMDCEKEIAQKCALIV